jgi:hypothetical protein
MPVIDAIVQNTPGYSQAYPAGVPRTYSWCAGTPGDSRPPPPGFTAVTGWGQVYNKVGASTEPPKSARIEIARTHTYVRLKATGDWRLVQNQTEDRMEGGHFVGDFSENRAIPMTIDTGPDGIASMDLPPIGYNNHFWIVPRGTFPADSVDGVYVRMQMRITSPNAAVVANVGADWWRDSSAPFVEGFSNNPGAGVSNWVVLTEHWSTLHFYSIGSLELRAGPPPPLAGYDPVIEVKRIPKAAEPSPCLPVARQDLRVAAGLDRPLPALDPLLEDRDRYKIIKPEPAKRRRR